MYEEELIGNDLGMFNNELKVDKQEGVSVKSLFIGKKCYVDYVIAFKDNQLVRELNLHLKGCSEASIYDCAKRVYPDLYNCDKVEVVYRIMEDLYNGSKHLFNLLCDRDRFEFRDFSFRTRSKFERSVKFS
jgi:hypothetical protein